MGNYGEVIDYLQRHIRREMERQDVPGLALALVDDQQLVWARGFGYADRQHKDQRQRAHRIPRRRPVQATDRQRDPATGRTRPTLLDAPLQDTLREFYVRSRFHADQSEADRAITFRRLLSHQSGLPGEHLPPLFGERPNSLGQLPAKVSGVWLSNPPGTQVAHSNLGYELVGAAIERNTGKHFEQHMREHLLDPLQMTRSSFARNALPQAQRARGYSGGGGGRPAPPPPATSRSTTCGAARSTSAASSACCSPTGATRSASFSGNTPSRRCSASRTPAMPWTSTARWAWPGSLSPCGSAPLEGGIRHYEYASATRGFSAHLILLPEQRLAAIVMSNADDSGSLTASLARQAASLMLQVKQGARRPAVQPTPRAPRTEGAEPGGPATAIRSLRNPPRPDSPVRARGSPVRGFRRTTRGTVARHLGLAADEKRLLGFWPVGVDSAGQLQLDVVSYDQRRILVSRRHDQTAYLGERIEPTSLPQAWNEAVGTYRVASTGRHSYLNGLSIRIEDGFLLVRGQAGGTRSGEFILQPIDSAHAVLAGSGQGLGDTFSRDFDGLNALGYRFAQQDTKARPWLQRKESP
ncbi:serine hydrolase domain-containing protein [Pseudomonas aeruginosa]